MGILEKGYWGSVFEKLYWGSNRIFWRWGLLGEVFEVEVTGKENWGKVIKGGVIIR